MTAKRRRYGEEFKQEAVRLVTEQGYSNAEAARSLGVAPKLLGIWRRKCETVATGDSDMNEAEREELERLRAENRRLRMERDILKKATAFFVNEKK